VTRIVVGIDTSPQATRALEWAVEEARLRDAVLEVVHAYPAAEIMAYPAILAMPPQQELEAAATAEVDGILEKVDTSGVPLVRTVRSGGAAGVLCNAAEGADLMVVGARGLGGFKELLLGSVSHQVATHARCPVVIVGPGDR
jgi:nucleotide-binding universal stress UspA family protein